MAIARYSTISDLLGYLNGTDNDVDGNVVRMLSTSTNGIEGIPYQFLPSVDRRISETTVGRKYAEKIFSRMPLLFLTPCDPVFMDDFNNNDKNVILDLLFGNLTQEHALTMLSGEGRDQKKFYSTNFNYEEYYNVLDPMLLCIAIYLGLQNEKIPFNGDMIAIKNCTWRKELNESFKTFFSSAENLVFYMDGMNTVSENFTNNTTESSISGMINGTSDQVNELKFLFGSGNESLASALASTSSEALSTLGSGLSSITKGKLGGGIINSVTENLMGFLDGGKIVFPKIWQDSNFDRSYQLDFKLRSPDHDSLSIFLNVLKPYCKLLALTIPRSMQASKLGKDDPNIYRSPFLVRAAAKGMFNIDMGIISSLSITKGAECCWNDDGLPTQIDISITIDDLYSSMHSSEYSGSILGSVGSVMGLVNNTAYQDFLANAAGLNIAQMEMGRKAVMATYLMGGYAATEMSRLGLKLDQAISNRIYKLWRTI